MPGLYSIIREATLLDPRHPEHRGCAGVDTMVEFAGEAAVDPVATQLVANEHGLP